MSDTIELASTVLSVGISTQNLGRDLLATIKGLGGEVGSVGRSAGSQFASGFQGSTKGSTKGVEADVDRLKKTVADAGKVIVKSRAAEGDAARKVAIDEAKLNELRDSGRAKTSQILAAEDRLEKSRRALAIATDKATADQQQFTAAQNDLQRELDQTAKATDAAASKSGSFGARLKAAISGNNPFTSLPAQADKAGDESAQRMSGKLGSGLKAAGPKIGGLLAAGIVGVAASAGLAFGSIFSDSIAGASNLEQSQGAVLSVFKADAAQIQSAAQSAAQNFGLSQNAYNELASTLGAGLKNKGLTDFADKTQEVIGLGADLAAQFGGSTKDAVEAIGSLMRGESDPIEKYGVSINEAAVAAELAASGQDKLTGAALETAKAQARLRLLFEQTADAQGAFGRESDTFAGKQQRFNAGWENFTTQLGSLALPALTDFMGVLSGALPTLTQFATGLSGIGDVLFKGDFTSKLTEAFGWEADSAQVDFLLGVRDAFIGIGDAVRGVTDILLKGDFTTGFLGIEEDSAVVDWLLRVRDGFLGIGTKVQELWAVAQPILMAIWDTITTKWAEIQPQVQSIFGSVQSIVINVMSVVQSVIGLAIAFITDAWRRWGPMILGIIGGIFDLLAGIFQGFFKIVDGIWTLLAGIFSGDTTKMMDGLQKIFSGQMDMIGGIIRGGVAIITSVWKGIESAFSGPVNWVINNVLNPLIRKINEVAGAFGVSLNLPEIKPLSSGSSSGGSASSGGGMGNMRAFRAGGILGGYTPYSQGDDQLVKMRSGEGVTVSEALRGRLGKRERARLLALNRAALTGKMREFYAQWETGLAGGGIVPNATQGFRGYNESFLQRIKAWAAATGRTWYMTGLGGGRTREQQALLYARYLAGTGPLAAPPGGNGPHIIVPGRGAVAMDLSPRPGEIVAARSMLGSFGLGLTVRGEPWHVGNAGGSLAGGVTDGGDGGVNFAVDLLAPIRAAINAAADLVASHLGDSSLARLLAATPKVVGNAAIDHLGDMFNVPGYVDGTTSAAPGVAWVGERGPELVRFRGGEQVIPAGWGGMPSELVVVDSDGQLIGRMKVEARRVVHETVSTARGL